MNLRVKTLLYDDYAEEGVATVLKKYLVIFLRELCKLLPFVIAGCWNGNLYPYSGKIPPNTLYYHQTESYLRMIAYPSLRGEIVLGEFAPDSMPVSTPVGYKFSGQGVFIIASVDYETPHSLYFGLKNLHQLGSLRSERYKKSFAALIDDIYRSKMLFWYKNANDDLYDGDSTLLYKETLNNVSYAGYEWVNTEAGKKLKPYWDIPRSQALYQQIPREDASVGVVVEKNGLKRAGMGSSIRAAVAFALPQDEPFSSLDITSLRVVTDEAYRIHEVNADVFSDDLAFIRTHLKDLISLDLSKSRFYDDTVPRSAFDSSLNIEYAYNLPKGNLSRLTHITLPNTVKSVDAYTFRKLSALRRIELPHVTHIGAQAFEGCVSLDTVVAPEAQHLEEGAFYGCSSLTIKGLKMGKLKEARSFSFVESGITSLDLPPDVQKNNDPVTGEVIRVRFHRPWGL